MRVPADPYRFGLAPLGVALVALALSAALFWPLPLALDARIPSSAFGDSHVWAFDQAARMIGGEIPWSKLTDRAGFPRERLAPLLGWAPAIFATPLRGALGPLGAFNAVFLATPALVALLSWLWLRRATGAGRLAAAAGAIAFTFSAPNLANLAAGNIDKAQVWVYPAWLIVAWLVVGSWRGALALPLAALVALAAAFSEPYLGLFLPLIAAPLALGLAMRQPGRIAALVRATLLLGVTALALSPAKDYYGDPYDRKAARAFSPAPAPDRVNPPPPFQDPVAEPTAFFVAEAPPADLHTPAHVVYLGIPLLLVVAALARRPFPGRATGLTLLGVGALVALGPQLLLDDQWATHGGEPYLLPMAALEALGYPLARGGQYYRAAPIAALGLATLLAGGLGAATRWWERGLGLFVVPVMVLDAMRVTGPWPRPSEQIPGLAACAAIAASSDAGAVLALPLSATQTEGGRKLLMAALHGRATTALPLHVPHDLAVNEAPWLYSWRFAVDHRQGTPTDALRTAGFAFVLHTPLGAETIDSLGKESLTALLGPPTLVDGEVSLWAIGPAKPRPGSGGAPLGGGPPRG